MKEVSNDDSSEEESAKPVKNTKLKEEVKNVVDNISPATMIETVTLIEDLRDLFKDRPEDYNALMELVRRMNPEGIDHWSAYQKISGIFGNMKTEHSIQLASRVLRFLKFPSIYVEGIRESGAISKMKVALEENSIFNDGSDEEGRGADSKSTGGAERRSARQKKKLEQDQVFVTPEVKGDIKQFTKLVKDRFTPGDYVKFIQAMDKYLNKTISFEDAAKKFVNCLKEDSDLLQKFISFWEPPLSTRLKQYASKQSDSKRDQARSSSKRKKPTFDDTTDTSTLDLDQLERTGPSYVVLPEQWRKALCSGRTALHRSVLNDKYMIVEGQEGYFKESTKNSAEEVLFRCEEDQYEFDRILEVHKTSLKKMQELQKNPEEEYDQILEHVYMKCILNMYRSNDEVIHVLRSRDKAKMGDIITKLEDKITEMKGLREQWNVVWAYTHYKHNLRSYDHQGQAFYVKDFKAMRPEALLGSIRQKYYFSLLKGEQLEYCMKVSLPLISGFAKGSTYMVHFADILNILTKKMFPNKKEQDDVLKVCTSFMSRVDDSARTNPKFLLHGDSSWIVCMRIISVIATRIHKMVQLRNFDGSKFNARQPPNQTLESFVGSELFENVELAYQGQSAWEPLEAKYTAGIRDRQMAHETAIDNRFKELAEKLKKVVDPNFRLNEERRVVYMPHEAKYDYFFDYLLKSLVNGQMDRVAYEENCMMLFGPQAYVLFTLDHWIANFIRVCYEISKDESSVKYLSKPGSYELKYIKPSQKIQYTALHEKRKKDIIYYFGILDFKHKSEEFLKQFTWLNYARLHLDRSYYYEPKYPLFLDRNLKLGMAEKDRLAYVTKNLNSEAKFDFNHHGYTGYLIARDFVQYRGPKRRSKNPRKKLEQICSTLHTKNAEQPQRMQE